MQVTPEVLQHIYINFDMRFNAAFTNYTPLYTEVATVIPSTTKENRYPMRNILPKMRKWVGERVVQNAGAQEYAIKNEPYEATIAVKKEDVEDDNLNFYNIDADTLGDAAAKWPDEVVFDLLKKGEEVECYDGQNFFDTDHPALNGLGDGAGGTLSNILEVNPDAEGRLITRATLAAATAKAAGWVNDRGDPLGINFNLLVVPGQREFEAAEALAPTLPGGGANVMANRFKILPVYRLNDRPDEFYLMDTTRPIKPLIWQKRKDPEFVALTAPTDENVFWRKEFIYGVDARGNAGFGLWFLALKVKKAHN